MPFHLDGATGSHVSAWVVVAAGLTTVLALLAGASLSVLGRGVGRWAPTLAGALLLTLVGVDLLPDALADGGEAGLPTPLLALVALLGLAVGGAVLRRRAPDGVVGCCSGATGRLAAVGLATHGIAEGLVVGLGLGLGESAGLVVVAVVAVHRVAEGYALGTALRRSRTRPALARPLVGLAALAPVVGGAAAEAVRPGEASAALLAAGLSGLLAAVALTLLAAGRRPAVASSVASPAVASSAVASSSVVPAVGSERVGP